MEDSTLRVQRQASGGKKNRSANEDEKTRKCFAFNKQRQRKEQGVQQGLATIPENSVYMTEYDLKSIQVDKEHVKEVKKCKLRNQKNEIKCRSVDDRHMKYQQYLERSALRRSAEEHSGAKLGGPAVVLARFIKSTSSRIYSKHNRILYLREHIPENIFWIHLDTTKQYICATSHHEHMRENIF